MTTKSHLSMFLIAVLALLPSAASSQFDPGLMPAKIFEVLDPGGTRLGIVIVAGEANRGYSEDTETWRFSESALLQIGELPSLEITVLAQGSWDDRWIVEALAWQPEDTAVEWTHPATVEWTPQEESLPPVTGGTYFGDPTLGGVEIAYSSRGPSSLTWFELIEGDYLLYDEGAVFERGEAPGTGSWWQGSIEP